MSDQDLAAMPINDLAALLAAMVYAPNVFPEVVWSKVQEYKESYGVSAERICRMIVVRELEVSQQDGTISAPVYIREATE